MNRHPPGLNRTAHPFPTRRSSDLRNEGAPPGEPPGEPIGERIAVSGRVLDEAGRPQPHTLVEVWQANAAGRYVHTTDQHDAPLDPNFFGGGRCVTDAERSAEHTSELQSLMRTSYVVFCSKTKRSKEEEK